MDLTALIADAEANGVTFKVVNDQLRIGTPKSQEHWQDKLEPHRGEILAHLSGEPMNDDDDELCSPIAAMPFPVNCLPGVVGAYIVAAAKAIGCDTAFIALPILAALARAIGNSRVIRLKRTWTEPAIIWAAIIGKSGTHKTPSLQAAMKFVEKRQAKSILNHAQKVIDYQAELAQHQRDLDAWKKSKSTEPPPWKPEEPVCIRYVTSDCTIEALAALLAVQFDGLLVSRDELAGWLAGIAEYKGGKGSDLGHWLAAWSAAPLTVDRKTGAIKMLHVPRAAVNLIGGIQPGVLRRAIAQEHMQDGLCARLLFAMPEPRKVVWSEATVHPEVEAAIEAVYDALFALEPAADEEGNNSPYPLDLTPEAKAVWVEYFNRHRAELVDLDDDLAAAWSKLEAYAARFALIIQLATDPASEAIDETAMSAAIELSDWFGNEAQRVYGLFVEDAVDQERRELVELIRRKGGSVTPRDLMRCCRKFKQSAEAEAALIELVSAKLGRWESIPAGIRGGHPTRVFQLVDTVDVDTTPGNHGENGSSVSVNAVSTLPLGDFGQHKKCHDPDAINRLLAEAREELE
jgi:hypothetical protein